jgi:hypothetical protein
MRSSEISVNYDRTTVHYIPNYSTIYSQGRENLKSEKLHIFCRNNFLGLAYSGGWSPNWVHLAPRPFTVLLCLTRMIVRMENYSVE